MGADMCLCKLKAPSDQDLEYLSKMGKTPQRGRHSNLVWYYKDEVDESRSADFAEVRSLMRECTIPDTDMFNLIDVDKICEHLKLDNESYSCCSIFYEKEEEIWNLGFRNKEKGFRVKISKKDMQNFMLSKMIDVYVLCVTEVEVWHKGWDLLDHLERKFGDFGSHRYTRCTREMLWIFDDHKAEGHQKGKWSEYDEDLYFIVLT